MHNVFDRITLFVAAYATGLLCPDRGVISEGVVADSASTVADPVLAAERASRQQLGGGAVFTGSAGAAVSDAAYAEGDRAAITVEPTEGTLLAARFSTPWDGSNYQVREAIPWLTRPNLAIKSTYTVEPTPLLAGGRYQKMRRLLSNSGFCYMPVAEHMYFTNKKCWSKSYSINSADYTTADGSGFSATVEKLNRATIKVGSPWMRRLARKTCQLKDAILAQTNDTNPFYDMSKGELFDRLQRYFALVHRSMLAVYNVEAVLKMREHLARGAAWYYERGYVRMYTPDFVAQLYEAVNMLKAVLSQHYYDPVGIRGYYRYGAISTLGYTGGAYRVIIPTFYTFSMDEPYSASDPMHYIDENVPATVLLPPSLTRMTAAEIATAQEGILGWLRDAKSALLAGPAAMMATGLAAYTVYPQVLVPNTEILPADYLVKFWMGNANLNFCGLRCSVGDDGTTPGHFAPFEFAASNYTRHDNPTGTHTYQMETASGPLSLPGGSVISAQIPLQGLGDYSVLIVNPDDSGNQEGANYRYIVSPGAEPAVVINNPLVEQGWVAATQDLVCVTDPSVALDGYSSPRVYQHTRGATVYDNAGDANTAFCNPLISLATYEPCGVTPVRKSAPTGPMCDLFNYLYAGSLKGEDAVVSVGVTDTGYASARVLFNMVGNITDCVMPDMGEQCLFIATHNIEAGSDVAAGKVFAKSNGDGYRDTFTATDVVFAIGPAAAVSLLAMYFGFCPSCGKSVQDSFGNVPAYLANFQGQPVVADGAATVSEIRWNDFPYFDELLFTTMLSGSLTPGRGVVVNIGHTAYAAAMQRQKDVDG